MRTISVLRMMIFSSGSLPSHWINKLFFVHLSSSTRPPTTRSMVSTDRWFWATASGSNLPHAPCPYHPCLAYRRHHHHPFLPCHLISPILHPHRSKGAGGAVGGERGGPFSLGACPLDCATHVTFLLSDWGSGPMYTTSPVLNRIPVALISMDTGSTKYERSFYDYSSRTESQDRHDHDFK
ncbi:hypothetical protein BDW42DRAFT_77040 [Aspergillus taichungensis]|uniref:Uncharacterized protein n=1 Tax=Aspergillus taichungensis TaxID=482145 RepID=A0A2J5I9N4_9EURO|nr:hypothetical protein BDW42DRAFT_77040 [Aspergillus taichungensis]